MSPDLKKAKKKDKKEKKKRSNVPEAEGHVEIQQDTEKKSILSMLDKLDNISKAKTRITEEKIRRGLIKSQPTEDEKKTRQKEIAISEVKKRIEELKEFKQNYLESGEKVEAIEVAKKIIDIAKTNGMNLIINEEKRFIDQIQAEISPKQSIDTHIAELKKKRHEYYAQKKFDEAIQIAEIIIDLAKEANLIKTIKTEENFINLIKSKLNKTASKEKVPEELGDLDFIGHIEKDDNAKNNGITHKERIRTLEIDRMKEEKQKFEEEKREFELKVQKFQEEKEAFNWEKQMLEEVKKKERDRDDNLTKEKVKPEIDKTESKTRSELEEKESNFKKKIDAFNQDKLKLDEIKVLFQLERKNIKERKHKIRQEKYAFEKEKQKFETEKLKFKEEKDTFMWEKQMFEEVKKFETDKG